MSGSYNNDLPNLPQGWIWATVEQFSNVGTGATPLRSNAKYHEAGTIPWVTSGSLNGLFIRQGDSMITELAVQETNAKVFPKNTLLVAMYGEGKTRGKVSELLIEAATNQACAALVFDGEAAYLRPFIKLFFQKNYDDLRRLSSGGVQPNLNLGIIKATKVPLAPLAEQNQIIERIEELFTQLDAGVGLLKKLKLKLKRYRQSVLKAAVEGKLTQAWREEHQDQLEPASVLLDRILKERRDRWEADQLAQMQAKGKTPKDDSWKLKYREPIAPSNILDSSKLPSHWKWVCIEQVADVGTGATPLRSNRKYYESGTIPWVTSGALNNLFVTAAEKKITDLAIHETNAKVFPIKTLLVAMYGEGKTRGKVSELIIEAATNQACAALVFDESALDIQPYIKIFLQKNYDDIRRLSSGGVQPNLNLSIIKATAIPVPPLEEQKEIIEQIEKIFSVIEASEEIIDKGLKRSSRLQQSILKQAFEGTLVPQNPDDEPAEKLLERIKAEKAKREAEKKSKAKLLRSKTSQQLKLM